MPIVNDYHAIAKRLRELRSPGAKSANEIADLEKWRDLARETARVYVEDRRRGRGGRAPSRRQSSGGAGGSP